MVNNFGLSRIAERCVKERGEKGPTLGILQKGEEMFEAQMLCRTSNLEVVLIFLKRTRNLLTRTAGICKEQIQKSKDLISRHVQILPTSQLKNSRESCRNSVRLRTRRSRIYCASVHMMSKNAFTPGENRYHQKIKKNTPSS